ncbi:MAG: peptide deformylase 2 [Acidimicrobiia bacterium]
MGAYEIRTFGDPVLRMRAREVTELDGELARVVDTMIETMYAAVGGGLAAPQVGIPKRFFTYVGDDEEPDVLINPEIVDARGEVAFEEGCLSFPEMRFEIVRPALVTVRGVDLDGHEVVLEAGDGYFGRMLQHEIDHLDGVLAIDRLDPDARKAMLREYRRRAAETSIPVPSGGGGTGS